jgi:copper resistance protein C
VKPINFLVVAVSYLSFSVTSVFAHAMLDHASPRVGNTVASAPKEVVLWFTQKLEPAFSSVKSAMNKASS